MTAEKKETDSTPDARADERAAILADLRRACEEGGPSGIEEGIEGLAGDAVAALERAADALVEAIRRIGS